MRAVVLGIFVSGLVGLVVLAGNAHDARALEVDDTAGTIAGMSVSVGAADRAAGGVIADAWRTVDHIARQAARGLCTERIHAMLATSEGITPHAWRARIWQAVRPAPDEVAAFARGQGFGAGGVDLAALGHRMQVEAYRQRLARAAERVLANGLGFALPPLVDEPTHTLELPETVATCLGAAIAADEIERYAAYPLYERRAAMVSALCAQFEIDVDKPLVLEGVAASEGKTAAELISRIEGDLGEIPLDEVEREAIDRYGRADDVTMLKARLTLDARRREDRRRAWIERVRREIRSECSLVMPDSPRTTVLASGLGGGDAEDEREALPVYYFAGFRCTDCTAGWQMLRETAAARAERVSARFLHHFPETDLAAFTDALEAECADRQGRFWDYGDWRMLGGGAHGDAAFGGGVAEALSLDAQALALCMADPETAVAVLDDTAEALRLGFRGAVPSWVVGSRPRRGFQKQGLIDRDIEEQLSEEQLSQAAGAGGEDGARGPLPTQP